mgnify:CR=1 FL=1
MQPVNILRDDQDFTVKTRLKLGQRHMRGVWNGLSRLCAAGVVKAVHQLWVAHKAFGRGHIFNAVLRPKPAFVAKGAKPAFRRNTCAGENGDHICHEGESIWSHINFKPQEALALPASWRKCRSMFQPGPTVFYFNGIFGVRVEIAQSLVFLVGIITLLSGIGNILWIVTILSMLLVSIYLHELGHAWGCQVQGIPVRRIVLFGGGGFCEHARSGTRREQELIVAMGPIVNLALWALGSLGFWFIVNSENVALYPLAGYLMLFARLNLMLFFFNMLPVQPLDGGKLLQLTLLRFASQNTAMRVAGAIGLVFAVLWWPALFYLWYASGWLLLFAPSIATHYQMAKGQQRF